MIEGAQLQRINAVISIWTVTHATIIFVSSSQNRVDTCTDLHRILDTRVEVKMTMNQMCSGGAARSTG